MARKTKPGIPYFSHDTDMLQDKKVKLLKAKHGLIGYAVYLRLLEEVYRDNGYYLHVDDDFNILFSDDNNIDLNVYILILNDCIKHRLFTSKAYDKHQILTSERIQQNYFNATSRRKEVFLIKDYLLVDPLDYYDVNSLNVNIEPLNVDIEALNVDAGTQSKVEYSKEEKRRLKHISILRFPAFWEEYPKKKDKKDASKVWAKIQPDEELFNAIMAGLAKSKQSNEWTKEGGQYIPGPARWLRAEKWNDELEAEIEIIEELTPDQVRRKRDMDNLRARKEKADAEKDIETA